VRDASHAVRQIDQPSHGLHAATLPCSAAGAVAGRVLLRHHAASVVDAVLARRFGAHGSITRACAWSRQDIALAP
jgi:hypothetical protein